ncbi:MAG: hypothetical protein CL672_04015 [Balneola sp.]|nr:hypothetical protein [Balneola sp.]
MTTINRYRRRKHVLAFATILISIGACNPYSQDSYTEQVAVEAYLIAGNILPPIRLSTTTEATVFYNFEQLALRGAEAMIWLLNEQTEQKEFRITYEEESPGVYQPTEVITVIAGAKYLLEVTHPEFQTISAQTEVPNEFSIINGIPDTLIYQSTEQLVLELSTEAAEDGQNYYIINTVSKNPIEEFLTPFYSEFLDSQNEEEKEQNLQELTVNSSGILNEGNFERNQAGNIEIRYPWLAVAFFGENAIIPSVIDKNLYDYIRSELVQLGGSTLSPGEIQNVLTPIRGGVGIFGSMARDTANTIILPMKYNFP